MTSPELVSALVPAYNHARYVRECLEALASQTYRPLELIIGDDCSTDGTADEIRTFLRERGDVFERVVFEERTLNLGIAGMLNTLLARAQGTYLFLNASDDRAEPQAIAILADVLDADPRVALAVGDSIIIDSTGRRAYWGPGRELIDDESEATYRTWVDYLRRNNRPGVFDRALFGTTGTLRRVNYVPNGKLFRRSAVEQVGGWHSGTLEDWDMNFRLSLHHRLRYVDEQLFAYRWHDANTITDPQRLLGLQAGTEAAIARELRNPRARLRSWRHRDVVAGALGRLGLGSSGSAPPP